MEELVTTIGKHIISLYLSILNVTKINFFWILSGVGTFGKVILVRRCTQKYEEYYALKIMAISDITQLKQVDHINDERTILAAIHHPFIVYL